MEKKYASVLPTLVSADFRQFDVPTLGADPISRADRDSRCTSNLLEFGFRFLEEYHSWLPFLSFANRMAAFIACRCMGKNRSKSIDLTTHLPSRLSTMNWMSALI
jgi:hypothetical protein